ncbi:helix-turn-helix domain-containing protein [Flammeovirga yaeyamensis]|uniref:Helix-turn-helix domain-containing protein n=1 Tax=Flammeovirga yaeyamensis TaxID=367791 RepID=A0AAX1N8T8_9BACT|nr:AraC family transcriptional regulator [Flammeovirga yaeyamensis]MBB3701313.1 AraC-like DNA-binding protein [Flammeovirga yaeyamensis]NMF38218.1 helix-turn-helix transcriptional regulator [Flammeovirga yaeyamensis]QWG02630.1 helix-turn-helix domain-containing protein [Flammeovirga yaeyamensis]
MEYQYIIDGDELAQEASYKKVAKDLKGEWDGEHLKVENSWCEIDAHSFYYLDGMYISISDLLFKKPVLFRSNRQSDDQPYFALKIGFTGTFLSDNESKDFNNLGVFFYNSTQNFEVEYPVDTRCQWVSIIFSKELFERFMGEQTNKITDLVNDTSAWFKYFPLDIEIENLVRALFFNLDKKRRRPIYFFTKPLEIISLIREKMDKEASGFKKNIHEDDLKIMMQLKEQYLSDFTKQPNLSDLSFKYGMSISKLNRVFKSIFDKPILQFYNQQKIEEAYRQINRTNKSITEISMDLNFTNVGYMSKMFKDAYGFPPSELRN